MLLENVVIGADQGVSMVSQSYTLVGTTHLRTQGKALRTEMMMKTLVMIPLAITAGCCTARYLMMSTHL